MLIFVLQCPKLPGHHEARDFSSIQGFRPWRGRCPLPTGGMLGRSAIDLRAQRVGHLARGIIGGSPLQGPFWPEACVPLNQKKGRGVSPPQMPSQDSKIRIGLFHRLTRDPSDPWVPLRGTTHLRRGSQQEGPGRHPQSCIGGLNIIPCHGLHLNIAVTADRTPQSSALRSTLTRQQWGSQSRVQRFKSGISSRELPGHSLGIPARRGQFCGLSSDTSAA